MDGLNGFSEGGDRVVATDAAAMKDELTPGTGGWNMLLLSARSNLQGWVHS